MSGLFAALQELERKHGLPERPIKIDLPVSVLANVISPRTAGGDHSGIRSIDENEARESTQPQPFDSAMSGDTVDSRGGQSNFSSVPVPDESNTSRTLLSEAGVGEARVGNSTISQPQGRGLDTLGAAGNILNEGGDATCLQHNTIHSISPAHVTNAKNSEAGQVLKESAGASNGAAKSNPETAPAPFTPAMFRAMIRQQCLGEVR